MREAQLEIITWMRGRRVFTILPEAARPLRHIGYVDGRHRCDAVDPAEVCRKLIKTHLLAEEAR